jgi:hypothetical protein
MRSTYVALARDDPGVGGSDPRGFERVDRDFCQYHGPLTARRGAGREFGADIGLIAGDFGSREEDRGERAAGQRICRQGARQHQFHGQVVAKAITAMARIEVSSSKISDIIGVIDEIARQTNLLALNAAVEAARAGDAGRSFAVVASEVRNLAQRSAQAAKDIKELLTSSAGQVRDGVDLVNTAGAAVTEILASINAVAEIVADIAAANVEQTGSLEQVNKALSQMDDVTQHNAALVEENAATAKMLDQQAQAMEERVSLFRLEDKQEGRPRKVSTGR